MSDPVSSLPQAHRPSSRAASVRPAFNQKFQSSSVIDGGDRLCFGMQAGRSF